MEFKFKRKYNLFFFTALFLHLLIVAFWFFFPNTAFSSINAKKTVCLLLLINVELILLFYLGMFRKKYYAFHNRLVVKHSFLKNLVISYKDIISIKEKESDSLLLGIGKRPSFKIYYQVKGRKRKHTVRTDNNKLLLKVLKNELEISKK